ncbi:C4b-binding protein alpha chain-like isoform X10 [Xyrichtys novacula]|uniref:C4b-binding protein alpha chain-like isoform X10 n=1 Tax=Xyrichtys novacula TaxID=13765 RepID=A0AAV1HEM5_XYRNO|nr:C4b-binding protein alpha chain-like isoform X10 [Xyrichtys novacula]
MAVRYFSLLCCLGLAFTAQAQDCSRPIPGTNMQLREKDAETQEFPPGSKVGFTCVIGYTPAGGSPSSVCTGGVWTPVTLTCERKSCGSPGDVLHGHIEYHDGTEFGDTAEVICDEGYKLVGRSQLSCGDQGWKGRLPVCEVTKCEPPPQIADGVYYPESEIYEYRESIQYTCSKDFSLVGSKYRSCSGTGTFEPEAPTCSNIKCPNPEVENGDRYGGYKPSYKYKDTVQHKCTTGYTPIGDDVSTCGPDGKWSPPLLRCEPKSCSQPVGGSNMALEDKTVQIFPHGSSVTFACIDDFDPEGNAVIKCMNGDWSRLELTCKRTTKPPKTTKGPVTVGPGGKGDGDDKTESGGGNDTARDAGIALAVVSALLLVHNYLV